MLLWLQWHWNDWMHTLTRHLNRQPESCDTGRHYRHAPIILLRSTCGDNVYSTAHPIRHSLALTILWHLDQISHFWTAHNGTNTDRQTPIVHYVQKKFWICSKMMVLPYRTLSQTPDIENFASAWRSLKRVISLAWQSERSQHDKLQCRRSEKLNIGLPPSSDAGPLYHR